LYRKPQWTDKLNYHTRPQWSARRRPGMEVCKHAAAIGVENARLGEAEERIRSLELRLAEAEGRRDALESALKETRAHLRDILGSRLWRFPGPVRSLSREVRSMLRPLGRWARRAEQPVRVPRILVIDEAPPTHDQDSGSLRIFRILSILKSRPCHLT